MPPRRNAFQVGVQMLRASCPKAINACIHVCKYTNTTKCAHFLLNLFDVEPCRCACAVTCRCWSWCACWFCGTTASTCLRTGRDASYPQSIFHECSHIWRASTLVKMYIELTHMLNSKYFIKKHAYIYSTYDKIPFERGPRGERGPRRPFKGNLMICQSLSKEIVYLSMILLKTLRPSTHTHTHAHEVHWSAPK